MRPSANAPFELARGLTARRLRKREARHRTMKDRRQLELEFPAIAAGSSSSASIRPTFAARIRNRHAISNWSWPDAVEEVAARPAAVISLPPAPINMRYAIERSMLSGKKGIAALATSP